MMDSAVLAPFSIVHENAKRDILPAGVILAGPKSLDNSVEAECGLAVRHVSLGD